MKKLYIFTLLSLILLVNQSNAQWTNLNAPAKNYETYASLAVSNDGKNLISDMSDLSGKSYLVSSHDFGASWQKYSSPLVVPGTAFWEGDVLYYINKDLALLKSIDFGATTSIQSNNSGVITVNNYILRMPDGKWYLANGGYNYVSTDQGINWTKSTGGIYGQDYLIANNGNTLATEFGAVYYGTDGMNWNKSTTLLTGYSGSLPELSKAADGTILGFLYSSPSAIIKSSNNGLIFNFVNAIIPANTNHMYFYGNDIIATDMFSTTYKSTDGGSTFSKINAAPLMSIISGMISNGKNIYLFGMSGIYIYGNAPTGIKSLSENKLSVFPNPCQNSIHLESDKTFASIRIMNLAGQLVFEGKPIDNHIDFSSVKSGIYLLTAIEKDGQKSTVKIVKK